MLCAQKALEATTAAGGMCGTPLCELVTASEEPWRQRVSACFWVARTLVGRCGARARSESIRRLSDDGQLRGSASGADNVAYKCRLLLVPFYRALLLCEEQTILVSLPFVGSCSADKYWRSSGYRL